MPHQKLLTKEIRRKLPALYSQEEEPDPMAWVKFFTPDSSWTWYATEGGISLTNGKYAPVTDFELYPPMPRLAEDEGLPEGKVFAMETIFFGLVDGHDVELGYFVLSELEETTGPMGLHIERDQWWEPRRLSQIRREIGERGAS